MTYQALARKYRPKRFAELIGQDHVAAGLAGAVARNRVAHAYLLAGPRGVGKTTAARILAMALNCERRGRGAAAGGEPCGACDSCMRIWSGGANLDVVEIDAASNRGVDDARELRERAAYAPSTEERSKIYIVDEAHMLTREAWNALLKILEEPPPRVVFVFATTEPQKIANTAAPVLSRMQRFDFRRIGPQAVVQRLHHVAERERITVEEDALALIARVAAGGLRDALSLLDQALAFGEGAVTAARVRDALGLIDDEVYAGALDLVAERRSAGVFPLVARLVDAGTDLSEFVGGLGDVLRALLLRVLGGEPEGLTETLRTAIARHAPGYRAGDLLRMLRLLAEGEEAIRRSPNARLYVETLLLQWTLLDRTVDLSDVMRALGTSPPARSAPPAPPPSAPPSRPQSPARAAAPPPPVSMDEPRAAGEPTLERVRALWPVILDAVGQQQQRMLREALGAATPVAVTGGELVVEADSDVHRAGLERGRGVVESAVAAVLGASLRLMVRAAGGGESGDEPRRLNQQTDREERLRSRRARDPALDSVADAMDLELLE